MEMGPVHNNMQSYPNQKDQIYYRPHCYPGMEAVPTQMYVNMARPPMAHGYWPWGSNYGSASPVPCHGCCSHSYSPAHCAWGSPYTHVPPHHCPGNYPFPVQYMPPPPYYAMEQPRYEYEKNIPKEHHCCGCPNHSIHQKEQKSLRIEEEEPQIERRRSDSLIPFQSKNWPSPTVRLPPDYVGSKERMGDMGDGSRDVNEKYSPYPIVWLPPENGRNKEQGKVESTGKDGSCDAKTLEDEKALERPPVFGNGWFPFDLNSLVSAKNRGDGKENCQQDDDKQNFPFPLFWMPYKPEEKGSEKHMVKDANTISGLESGSGSGGEKNLHVNRENVVDQAASKARDIPVKEGAQQVENESSVKQDMGRDAFVKDSSDNHVNKVGDVKKVSSKEGSKRKSPSPPKSSKLPPVCLRVDPLPRRKNGNEGSQSPTPASNKQKPCSQSSGTSNVCNSSENKEQAKIPHNEFKENKGIKNIEVVDGRTSQGENFNVKIETPVKLPAESSNVSVNQVEKTKEEKGAHKPTDNDAVTKGQSEDAGPAGEENEALLRSQEMKVDEVKKSPKRELSEEEAAVIIQSAYRGFEVRRWESIKKLKQIAKVQEQIADVKHLIQEMKSSSDIQGRDKQRNIVAETIMSLLLKLDTIQGLHPSIREVRKSVVRELVSLQEQLDSLMNEKPDSSQGVESMMTRDEDALNKSEDVISFQSDHETTPTDVLEERENQIDGGTNHEISEVNLIGEEASAKIENEAAVSSTNKVVDSAPEAMVKEEEESNKEDNETTQTDSQAHQNQVDGESNHDTPQVGEADQVVEVGSQKIETGVSESSMNKEVESAPEPTTEKDKKSEEVLENDETFSIHEDLVPGQGSEVASLQNDSSDKATDIVATDSHMLGSELAELPVGVLDELCAQEDSNDLVVEVDASKTDQAKQLEEAQVEPPIISEPHETADNEDSDDKLGSEEEVDRNPPIISEPHETTDSKDVNQILETLEILDFPHNGEPDTGDNCKSDDKYGFEEKVDLKQGDEAGDMYGVEGLAEAKSYNNRDDSDNCITQQSSMIEINSGEAFEELQFQATEESKPHAEESTDVPQQVEEFDHCGEFSEEKQPQSPEDSQSHVDIPQQGEKCNTKKIKEGLEEQSLKDATQEGDIVAATLSQNSSARDEVTKSNQRLIEENERLREMMENLMKSGQEQLMAISSLSVRVKDLEKKLSRKKKLKVKQHRAPKSGTSCITKFDGTGTDGKRTVGVAM